MAIQSTSTPTRTVSSAFLDDLKPMRLELGDDLLTGAEEFRRISHGSGGYLRTFLLAERNRVRNPPPRLRRYSPQRSLPLAGGERGRKREGPEGASAEASTLSGLSTRVVSGRGPNSTREFRRGRSLDVRSLDSLRSGDRCDPVIAPPRCQGGCGSEDPPAELTARRSRRIPVRPVGHPYRGGSSRSGFRHSVPTVRDAAGSPLWRDGQRRPPPMSWQTRIAIRFRDLRLLFATGPRGVHRADTRRPIKPRTRENPEGAPAEAAALSGLPGHSPGKRAPGR